MAVIQFDFDSIKNRIKERLSSKSEWANFLSYGVVDNLLDSIVQELVYIIGYKEYLTTENFWELARNYSSLLVQSPVHGYIIPRKQGSIGTLRISTDKSFNDSHTEYNIPINKFFQFSGNNIYVASSKEYTLTPSDNYIDILCKQGEIKTVSFSAQGNIYEEKIILDDSVDNDFFELYINNVLWKKVDTLFEYNENDLVYEVETKTDLSGVTLKFGNNIFGKKLDLNDQVIFKYSSTKGAEGNIFVPNLVKTVETQAFTSEGKPVNLYVTNITSFVGGRDYPSVEEIRVLSPKVYQTGDRASSLEDYQTKLSQFNYISKYNVWGAVDTLRDNGQDAWEFIPSEENVVHLALLDMEYANLSNIEKNQVIDDIYRKNDPTDLIRFENVEKINLIFNIDATIKNSSYTIEQVKANIEVALKNNYGIENINFSENVYNSDFIRLIDEVDGVRNHISFIQIEKKDKFFIENYVGAITLPIYPIEYSSVTLYWKDTSIEDSTFILFANCDINGNIVGVEGYNTNGSNLNLTTGKGSLIVNSGFTGNYKDIEIKVIFESLEKDLILNKRSDIFAYLDINITLDYPSI